ncbi:MAG: Phosphodiesterase/alkaline phosphatase D [uncultured Rubrobacteraceae bacterium]|uniref:Phosphodiesterase/alkaline phosphatase D n=1 Tax=uncultured Rubrobacteraceae bacterium TaxID=349277 RepID=A0A6J4PBD0_9ACTN|nr:MAG: Phosphodiesterase/alkaline phosphatase D [uncultured Rubrobacteraceae bacterium]
MAIRGNWDQRRADAVARMGEIDRRTFVKLTGAGAAALIFGYGPFTEKVWAQPRFSDYPFKLGVASGDPLPDGVVLWTRLAPDPLNDGGMPEKKVPVQWQVATDEGFADVVAEGMEFAYPELAHSVHVEVGGLQPAAEYFYRFRAGPELSPVGRTKTAPALGASLAEMSFAFVSCQMYEHGYYTAYRRMAEQEQLDLVVHLGDYIYEYGPNQYVANGGNVRTHVGPEIWSLPDYRRRHAQYRTDEDLQAAHAAFPFVVTWDDHEVENNYADEIPEGNQSVAAFVRRRAAAYQAYYEHMPLRRASVPTGPDMLLYRRLTYGNLAEFNVLDTRQYRDDQAGGTVPPNPRSLDPARTLTGEAQERWLLDGLADSGTTWNVLAQQVFFAQRDLQVGTGQRFAMDAWDGYVGSRDRISNFILDRDVPNPVVLTGDVHNNWACNLKADYDNPASETLGVEFVGSAVTSGGDGSDTGNNQLATVAENPHIKFFNGQRGYVRCTLTPDQWRADYRVLPYVKQPGAPIYTRASFVTEAGNPGLQLADVNEVQGTRVSSAAIESDFERIEAQEEADRRGRKFR